MKKLVFLLVLLSFTVIFSACPPLQEDDTGGSYGDVLVYEDPLDSYKWFEILDKIAKGGKYVSLDLSKATYKDGNPGGGLVQLSSTDSLNPLSPLPVIAFDPFPASASGKNFIVSITLPAAAQIIKSARLDTALADITDEKIKEAKQYSAFKSFSNLRSVKADNVTFIGNFAFADCTALTEVNFPRVNHTDLSVDSCDIGKYAFSGCSGLKEIKFNLASVIGEFAFKGCTSLSKIDFPEVNKIEKNAFEGCTSLVNVFFEKATKIQNEAFKGCTGLKKAEFDASPGPGGDPASFLPGLNIDNPDYSVIDDSVIFYSSVFNGCKSLEVLNVKNAWNVYFAKDVLANIGTSIDIYLFDDDGTKCFGHPQKANFLGEGASVSLKKVYIFSPVNIGQIPLALEANIRSIYSTITLDVSVNRR